MPWQGVGILRGGTLAWSRLELAPSEISSAKVSASGRHRIFLTGARFSASLNFRPDGPSLSSGDQLRGGKLEGTFVHVFFQARGGQGQLQVVPAESDQRSQFAKLCCVGSTCCQSLRWRAPAMLSSGENSVGADPTRRCREGRGIRAPAQSSQARRRRQRRRLCGLLAEAATGIRFKIVHGLRRCPDHWPHCLVSLALCSRSALEQQGAGFCDLLG